MTSIDEDEMELQAIVGTEHVGCSFSGCTNKVVDERGPVGLVGKDGRCIRYWVCEDHFEAVFMIIGQQERGAKVWDEEKPGDWEGEDVPEDWNEEDWNEFVTVATTREGYVFE